jgi:6-pyruvoyl-tetrahydropterin synthase related domain
MRSITDNRQSGIGTWKSTLSNRRPAIALAVVASFLVIVPAILWGIPSNLDLTNHFRFALPFYDAIAAGDLYPGWLAESNGGYGDPSFRFYPPALYYLLAVARFVIGDWYGATLLVFVVISIAGGLGMYFWSRSMLSSSSASWAVVFYALAPYHLNQLYQATMLAEWAGGAVLPFVFGFVDRVCERGRRRDVAGLAATYGLLVFTHLPLAVIGSLALFVYSLVKVRELRKLAKLAVAGVLGLSVSAVYWVTMVSEVRWIGVNQIQPDASVDYRVNFLLSTFSPDNLSVWWMNILALMTLMLFAPALLLLSQTIKRVATEGHPYKTPLLLRSLRQTIKRVATEGHPYKMPLLLRSLRQTIVGAALRGCPREPSDKTSVVVLTFFAIFMATPLSRPIWMLLKPLQETQFPWRWLVLISMGGSILAATGLSMISNGVRAKRMLVLGAMAIALAFTLSHVVREAQYFPPQKFENMLTEVRSSACVNYWFPIWARGNARKMTTEVEANDRTVTVSSWQPEHRKFSVTAGPATEARVRTFYYPHWTATSEAGSLPIRPDKDGALLISLPQNATSVELDFREPRKTKISTMSSLSGLIIIGMLALPFSRRRRND